MCVHSTRGDWAHTLSRDSVLPCNFAGLTTQHAALCCRKEFEMKTIRTYIAQLLLNALGGEKFVSELVKATVAKVDLSDVNQTVVQVLVENFDDSELLNEVKGDLDISEITTNIVDNFDTSDIEDKVVERVADDVASDVVRDKVVEQIASEFDNSSVITDVVEYIVSNELDISKIQRDVVERIGDKEFTATVQKDVAKILADRIGEKEAAAFSLKEQIELLAVAVSSNDAARTELADATVAVQAANIAYEEAIALAEKFTKASESLWSTLGLSQERLNKAKKHYDVVIAEYNAR